jgi:hypothetical protein
MVDYLAKLICCFFGVMRATVGNHSASGFVCRCGFLESGLKPDPTASQTAFKLESCVIVHAVRESAIRQPGCLRVVPASPIISAAAVARAETSATHATMGVLQSTTDCQVWLHVADSRPWNSSWTARVSCAGNVEYDHFHTAPAHVSIALDGIT